MRTEINLTTKLNVPEDKGLEALQAILAHEIKIREQNIQALIGLVEAVMPHLPELFTALKGKEQDPGVEDKKLSSRARTTS